MPKRRDKYAQPQLPGNKLKLFGFWGGSVEGFAQALSNMGYEPAALLAWAWAGTGPAVRRHRSGWASARHLRPLRLTSQDEQHRLAGGGLGPRRPARRSGAHGVRASPTAGSGPGCWWRRSRWPSCWWSARATRRRTSPSTSPASPPTRR